MHFHSGFRLLKIDVKHTFTCIKKPAQIIFQSFRHLIWLGSFVESANIEKCFINITKDANKLIYANLMIFCFLTTLFFHSVIIFIISIMSISDCRCCHFFPLGSLALPFNSAIPHKTH